MKTDRNGAQHDELGRWPEGVSGNPNGRPKRSTEERIRTVISENTTDDDLAHIWKAALEGAKNGDKTDREFVARYSWPRPEERIAISRDSDLPDLSDDDIRELLNEGADGAN